MSKPATRIAVLGSINMDLVIGCERLVRPGETVLADSVTESPGGKGANQAVAAARLGADVKVFGRIGDDAFALRLLENLQREGIDTEGVIRSEQVASGLAIVAVEASGENAIMVVPGANGLVGAADVERQAKQISACDVLLLQLEIPVEAVIAGIGIARQHGLRIILDPAPALPGLPMDVWDVDVVVPNQAEAATILNQPVETIEQASMAAEAFLQRGARNAVITLGDQGAFVHDGRRGEWLRPFAVAAVDATAAGDAFAGALAIRWTGTTSLFDAARYACAAGAVATSKQGAQQAMPSDSELQTLWRQHVDANTSDNR